MDRVRNLHAVAAFLLLALLSLPAAAQQSPDPDLSTILTRLEKAQAANRDNLQAYEVIRQYQFYGENDTQPDSTVIADVHFAPPAEKRYSIQQGSGRSVGVVKKILDSEVASVRSRSDDHDISRENYEFQYLGRERKDGVDCFVLKLTPRRKEKALLDGKAWVDAQNFLPWRVEGQVSKSPSWWVKQLDIELIFAPVHGMWLQTAAVGRADVRIFGQHTVVTRDLEHRLVEQVADRSVPRRSTRRPDALLGTGLPR